MAQGIINIIANKPTTGSKGSTNIIPLNYYDPIKLRDIEFSFRGNVNDIFSSIGLTWRDFTIDTTPFDHRYKELVDVKVVEYGTTDKDDLSKEIPDNSKPLLYKAWTGYSGAYNVGDSLGYDYKPNNIYETFNPAKIREWMDPDVKSFLITNISYPITTTSSVYYVKTKNIYSDGSESAVNILYSYRAEYTAAVDANYKPGLKYNQYPTWENPELSTLILPLLPNSVEILTSDKLFTMFEFRYENFKNPVSTSPDIDFAEVTSLSDLYDLFLSMYPSLHDFGSAGFPLKLTIWDMNYGNSPGPSQSRFIVNGAPMENGMGIPFSFFDEGKVSFITDGLPEGGKYTVFYSIMDIISGFVRARGDS